jgi:putative cofactor-binding repeat protein
MMIHRRDVILASLGLGLALVAPPRWPRAREAGVALSISPAGGRADQTAALQQAADAAAKSGTPLFLPPGIYATNRLRLQSGTHLVGVPERSILRGHTKGVGLLGIAAAKDVRIEGLVLDGRSGSGDGAMLVATEVEQLEVVNCRFVGASGDGLALGRVSGRIADCDVSGCHNTALVAEDPRGLEVARNRIHDCGDIGVLIRRSNAGETGGALIAENVIDRVATDIAVDSEVGARLAVVQANLVRNLFFRKTIDPRGNGIAVDADSVVTGNVIENVPGFGIVAGGARHLRDVSVTENIVRKAYIGIGIPAHRPAGSALISGNIISDTGYPFAEDKLFAALASTGLGRTRPTFKPSQFRSSPSIRL